MRTKTRGGRARPRLSKLPSPTPVINIRSLRFLNLKPLPEEENGDDNVASAYGDDESGGTKMTGGLGFTGECLEIDLFEGESCITCNRDGGDLLVCSESGCPIALHQNCMNCGPKFDDVGNFYCPYCWYKREVVRTRGARKKAMEAKKALSSFLDLKAVVGDGEKDGGRDEGKELNMSPLGRDKNCGDGEGRAKDDGMDSRFVEAEEDRENDGERAQRTEIDDQCKTAVEYENDCLAALSSGGGNTSHRQEKTPAADSISKERPTTENASGIYEHEILGEGENVPVEDSRQVDDSGNKRIAEDQLQPEPCSAFCVEEENVVDDSRPLSEALKQNLERKESEEEILSSGTESSNSDAETILEHQSRVKNRLKMKATPNVNSPKKLFTPVNATPKKIARTQNQKVAASKKSRQNLAAEKFTNLAFGKEKRKRLHWTAEEEEMLKEGVKRFSTEVNKNLPWRKILDFGRHIFDPTRNPSDLKDKWRNIMAKESSANKRS